MRDFVEHCLAFYSITNLIVIAFFMLVQILTWIRSNRTTLAWVSFALCGEVIAFSLLKSFAWGLHHSMVMIVSEVVPVALIYLLLQLFQTKSEKELAQYADGAEKLAGLKNDYERLLDQIEVLEKNESVFEGLAESYSKDLKYVKESVGKNESEFKSKISALEQETKDKIDKFKQENVHLKNDIAEMEQKLQRYSAIAPELRRNTDANSMRISELQTEISKLKECIVKEKVKSIVKCLSVQKIDCHVEVVRDIMESDNPLNYVSFFEREVIHLSQIPESELFKLFQPFKYNLNKEILHSKFQNIRLFIARTNKYRRVLSICNESRYHANENALLSICNKRKEYWQSCN